MTIQIILFLSVLVPFFLFAFVEMNHYYTMKAKFQVFNDNIASSSVWEIDKEKIKSGIIELDDLMVEDTAKKIMASAYKLNDDLTITQNSIVKETPVLKVYTVNTYSDVGEEFITDEGIRVITHKPSVIIYTQAQPIGILFSKFVNMPSITVQEIELTPLISRPVLTTTNSPNPGTKIDFYMNNIYNPLRFDDTTTGFPLKWSFNPIPMLAGGNVDFSIINISKDITQSATYSITVTGTDYSEVITGNMGYTGNGTAVDDKWSAIATLPYDAPVGASVIIFIEVQSVSKKLDTKVDTFPSTTGTPIGIIEGNMEKILRIKKLL